MALHPAERAEPVGLERLQERFLLEELQVPEAPVALAALAALVEPGELAEPGVLVQPVELVVLAELAEPEPLPDEGLRDEPGLVAFALAYQPLYDGEVVRFGRETEESFTLVVRWKETEQESSVFILFMPSWLRNQRAYVGLVLTRHYNKLSYHRISLGAL